MARKIVLAAAFLIFSCVQFGSSEVVPDRVVYTEVKKTLLQGIPGVLTCRFYRDPLAVYWKKGSNPDDASLMLLWHEGQVSGPRYSDGSCVFDENYSLIIKNVSFVDAGRYYCVVSNYFGVLINNYTDVFVVDTAIETKSQVTLQMRPYLPDVVQCTVHIRPRIVSWIKKSTTSSSYETLVIFENNGTVVKRSGVGYKEGNYNISEDYSLVIKDVQVYNEGIYTCNVTDFDTGSAFQDDTLVNVVVQPREPFPTILECLHDESVHTYCSIPAEPALTITCHVSDYYPDINLIFLYGSREVEILETREQNNTDGTKNKTITITALGSKEIYTCVASNIPGTPLNRSTSALLHGREHFNSVVLVAVPISFAAVLLFSLTAYFICRRKHRHSNGNYISVGQVEFQSSHDKDVTDLNILKRVNGTLLKHYRRIYDLTDTKDTFQADIVISENKTALFHTAQMLTDHFDRQQNPESTCHKSMNAIEVVISHEDKSVNVWPFNEELKWIARHLNQESMKEICKKLKITYKPEDTSDERKRYNSLRKWRNKVALENVEKKHQQLSSAVRSKNLRGLLPPLKRGFIYKTELVDVAFNLLMSDILPVTEALGINATKLVSYRPAFHPSHLEIGTIGLLSKLLNSFTVDRPKEWDKVDIRIYFYSMIGRLTYFNVAARGLIAYDMSYGELYAILEVMASTKAKADVSQGHTSKAATQSEEDKCEKGAASKIPEDGHKEKTDIENPESKTPLVVVSSNQIPEPGKAAKDTKTKDTESKDQRTGIHRIVEIPPDLVHLQRVLQLTDQDIADGHESSHPVTAHVLFKIWTEKPRSSVFNYRAALAHELREIHLPDLANEVIAGKYITEQTSLKFIQNMVQGLNQDQLRSLGEILGLSEKDEHWYTSTPINVICQEIYEWVMNWTAQMKIPENYYAWAWESFKALSPIHTTTTSQKHRDLNDKLVENGFLDLAREIMIIEQQMEMVI